MEPENQFDLLSNSAVFHSKFLISFRGFSRISDLLFNLLLEQHQTKLHESKGLLSFAETVCRKRLH
jgi:hypothetical protein